MGKILKIIGLIFLVIILLIVSLVGYLYFSNRWIIDAKDLSGVTFGSKMFNDRLFECSPSFSYRGSYFNEPWEIRGIKKGKCIVYYYETKEINYETNQYTEAIHKCRLPKEIYTNAENIDWSSLLDNPEYCYW